MKKAVFVILLCGFLVGFAFILGQNPFAASFFEFGEYRPFQGRVALAPYPHLLVHRPGLAGQKPSVSTYLLVAPFKFGAEELLKGFAGQQVTLEGSLIYRENQTMIEVLPGSIKALEGQKAPLGRHEQRKEKLGKVTLKGEIVDSKCYLGVMNPGTYKVHRSCAIRCISGGIPPILMVSSENIENVKVRHFLLVSSQGKAVNREVLDLVAKPVQITGHVEKKGDLLILKADPKDYLLLP